ncbi:MAG: NAD(P)-dependent oxidoreductase [Clostridiaceae bacterium]|jgi:nucleoside-diphosphate-sugar epimerase|nr:NAD(P)-dependent oxidoreductase [Clostridiaceae bacterium]
MKILITGGYGFIGMYSTQRLLSLGHEVFVFDVLSKPPSDLAANFSGATAIKGDLLNPLSLIEAIKKYEIERIIHLAALRNNDSKKFPFSAFKLNCEGTMNCFEAARICGIKRVCFASSVAVLGKFELFRRHGYNIDSLPDDVPCSPTNVYGVTKRFCEMMSEQYNNLYDMKIIGVRLPIIFGAGKKSGSRSSYYNELIEKSSIGEAISVRAVVDEKFNIQYVKDSAQAVVCGCLASEEVSGIFNTGGVVLSMADYVKAIRTIYPRSQITIIDDPNATTVDDTCIDSRLAAEVLGFEPEFTLEQGIKDHMATLNS